MTNWTVWKITNHRHKKGAHASDRIYYFCSGQFKDPHDALTRVRAMVHSRTIRGGAKRAASDMEADPDYGSHFSIKAVARGLTKEKALELRSRLKSQRSLAKKIYNKPRK